MPFRSRLYLACFLALALAAGSPILHAQASSTASRGAGISVFGGYELANPEYGPEHINNGVALGFNFTRFIHFPVQPSLEARANFNFGPYANEHSYVFGLRGMGSFGRFQPYADFLVGPGTIHFPKNINYTSDNSIVYNYGGGVDVGLTRSFSLKLDVQAQHWNTGEFSFAPILGVIGVTYQIPFRPHVSQATIVP